MIFTLWFFFLSSFSEPRWASVNRGVLICDECCSVHRSLGRHSSQVRHLMHTPWPPTQLQVTTPTQETSAFSSVMSCQRLRCLHDRLLLAHDLFDCRFTFSRPVSFCSREIYRPQLYIRSHRVVLIFVQK